MSSLQFDLGHFFWSSSELMCLYSPDGYFKAVNPAFCKALGYTEKELLALPVLNFMHPDDHLATINVIAGPKSEAPDLFENRYLRKDGTIRWLSWSGVVKNGLYYFSARDVTERKKTELALSEERRNLKFVLENAPVILSCVSMEGVIVYSAGKGLNSMGSRPHQNVGRSIYDLYRDVPEILNSVKKAQSGEEHWESMRINGNVYQSKYSPLKDENQAITGVIICTLDVSEIRQAQELLQQVRSESILRQAEHHFQETFHQAAVGISHLSPSGHFLKVNQLMCDIMGYSETELVGRKIHDLLALNSSIDMTNPENLNSSRELSYIRKDGKIALASVRFSAVRDENNVVKYFIAVHQDITSRKELEESLRKSEEQFRNMAEAIPQIVWTANKDGAWEYYNQRWYEYTDQTFGQSQGWGWAEALHPEDRSRVLENWAEAILSLESLEIEFRLRNASNGTFRWHLCRALPIRDAGSDILRWFGTCTDIDDQKRLEQELKTNLQEIRRISEEKTKLIASEKAAIEASKLKSDFLANMSHEIRTPLNGVLGITDLLMETKLQENQLEYARIIQQSGKDLLVIINDILDLSKIEAGKMQLDIVPFNLADVLDDIAKIQGLTAEERGLDLIMKVPKRDELFFRGDPTRIRQILFNLTQNALKFTSQGSVQIQVWAEPMSSDKQRVLFMVTDTGIGISQENLKNLFAPFQQADASTTRKYGGTGLGLSICKKLITQMGGCIGVQSEDGKGSVFWFEIPFLNGLESHCTPTQHLDVANQIFTGRVLIAEDNLVNQKIARHIVEKCGLQVDVVGNGLEAVKAVKNQKYDLILMDCHMPEMDGFTSTLQIRTTKGPCQSIPIVALTADVVQGIREKCEASGMNDYLSKPMQPNELRTILGKYLGVSRPDENKTELFQSSSLDRLQTLRQADGGDFIVSVMEQFLKITPDKIKLCEKFWAEHRLEALRIEAHSLKSSSGALGALSLSQICSSIEDASIRHDFHTLSIAITDLVTIFEKTQTEMSDFIFSRKNQKQAI